jgi:GT2 family glycosyltransferase
MIYYFTPFVKGDLGEAYNHYCSLVPDDDDWITFSDGDIMQLHLNWGEIWGSILDQNKDVGIVTCLTNRAATSNIDQVCKDMYNEKNIIKHKKYAQDLFDKNQYSTKLMTGTFLSGFYFSFKKRVWKEVGGFEKGILHVDRLFYNKVNSLGKKCIVAQGFYVLHYYRLLEGDKYTSHLAK